MSDQPITFETAKLAYEKGYRQLTANWYNPNGVLIPYQLELTGDEELEAVTIKDIYDFNELCGFYKDHLQAPTQSALQKWLRDVHNIDAWVSPYMGDPSAKGYGGCIVKDKKSVTLCDDNLDRDTHEESLEATLQESLKLIPDELTIDTHQR